MAFWSSKDSSPARKYRFKMGPAGTNWWYVNSVTLPSFEINTNEYQLLNQKFKYPGVPTWNPVTISIIDVAKSVEGLKKVLTDHGFSFLQEDGIKKIASTDPEVSKDFIIEQMKDDGTTLRTWTLVNSFISSVNYGDLDYSSDDLVSIEIIVAYDYATTEK